MKKQYQITITDKTTNARQTILHLGAMSKHQAERWFRKHFDRVNSITPPTNLILMSLSEAREE